MKVIILHRAFGSPNDDWYPWLARKLNDKKIEVIVPALQPSTPPQYESWIKKARETLNGADEKTFIIGHSLGNTAAFRILESLPDNKKMGGMVVVAGIFSMPEKYPPEYEPIARFYDKPINWAKISRVLRKAIVLHDRKDNNAPFVSGEAISKSLGVKLIATDGKGHYLEKELPEVLEALNEIMK